MRVFVFAFLALLNYILQTTLFEYIRLGGIAPNTALVLVVSYGILRGEFEGAVYGFFVGLLQDVFFGKYLGYFALVYSVCGYVSSKPFKNFFKENYFFPILLVGIASIFNCLLFYLSYIFMRSELTFKYYLQGVIIPEVIYTTALAIIYYLIVYQVNRKLENYQSKKSKMFDI